MSPADRRAAIRRNHSKLSLTRQWQPLGHTSGSGDDDHSHDESEHTDGDHEHTEPDPDAGSDHAEGRDAEVAEPVRRWWAAAMVAPPRAAC